MDAAYHGPADRVLRWAGVLKLFDRLGRHSDGTYKRRAEKIPNFLCWLRIYGGPPSAIATATLELLHIYFWAQFALAVLTGLIALDLFDGPIARRAGLPKRAEPVGKYHGATLDAASDKAVIVPALIAALVITHHELPGPAQGVFAPIAGILIGFDAVLMLITVMEANAAAKTWDKGATAKPRSGWFGKTKTFLEGVGATLVSGSLVWEWPVAGEAGIWLGTVVLAASVPFAIMSVVRHLDNFAKINQSIGAGVPRWMAKAGPPRR